MITDVHFGGVTFLNESRGFFFSLWFLPSIGRKPGDSSEI